MTEVKIFDEGGSSFRFLDVDGSLYPSFPVEIIRGLPDLEMRSDDVLVCAYPKSGTHWVWEIIRQLLAVHESAGLESGLEKLTVKEKDVGMLEMTPQEQLRAQLSPRVLNTHVYFNQLPKQVVARGCRIVILTRDPRDVAVSYYNHHRKLSELYDYHGQWEHYLPLFLQGKLDYGCWFDYYTSWERGLKQHQELPVLSLTYENIKQDSLGATRQLASFLGVQCAEASLAAVDRACAFHNMKLTKGHLETDAEGQPVMYRKGVVGDWKNIFTVAQAETFASVFRDKIKDVLAVRANAQAASYNMGL